MTECISDLLVKEFDVLLPFEGLLDAFLEDVLCSLVLKAGFCGALGSRHGRSFLEAVFSCTGGCLSKIGGL